MSAPYSHAVPGGWSGHLVSAKAAPQIGEHAIRNMSLGGLDDCRICRPSPTVTRLNRNEHNQPSNSTNCPTLQGYSISSSDATRASTAVEAALGASRA